MSTTGLDLSSWADRNRREPHNKDAGGFDVGPVKQRKSTKPLKNLAPPLELEPLSKPVGTRGRDTVRSDVYNTRSVSMSPSARDDKRAQYDQANAEYAALMKQVKNRKPKWGDENAKGAKPAASLPMIVAGTNPAKATARSVAETRPSARTPPPTIIEEKPEPSARTALPTAAFAGADAPLMELNDDNDTAFEAVTEDEGGKGKRDNKRGNRINVLVRKRPLNERETAGGDNDCVDVVGPAVHVNAMKLRVDLTEYTESHHYAFDGAVGEMQKNREVYDKVGRNLIDCVFEGGSASCFAYGQTGSGKTYTMIGTETEPGLYVLAAEDIFERKQDNHRVFVSLYEIYCNSLFDLLNQRAVVVTREDANHRVNVCGLTWHEITSTTDLLRVIDKGTLQRRTGSTSANEFSSRSHAVMTITLRDEHQPKFLGSLNVVDLAGSERAADTAANDKQTRLEGAEINKSLLALKECIRGLDERKKHIPFRGSKLTEVLRDSFVGNSRTAMIATISPATSNAEHTLNTLRYAFRVKGLSFDCPMPSKERNAPRPTQRSKSTDPAAGEARDKAVPSVPVKREKHARNGKERRHRKGRTPRTGAAAAPSEEALKQMEEKMASQMDEIRGEMQALRQSKQQDQETISKLMAMNEELMAQIRASAQQRERISRQGDRERHSRQGERSDSAHGSRRGRRRKHTDAEQPAVLETTLPSPSQPPKSEEIVTLEELAD